MRRSRKVYLTLALVSTLAFAGACADATTAPDGPSFDGAAPCEQQGSGNRC